MLAAPNIKPVAITIPNHLGSPASAIVEAKPFKDWPVEKSFNDDLEEPVGYVFPQHGLELLCDRDDTIVSIFLKSDDFVRFDDSVADIPFSSKRHQVLERLGAPTRSGEPISDPILGEFGPRDRFARPGYAIHVEYRADADCIKMITLMRADVVP